MALDGIYLHLLKNEIKQKVVNGRVDKIHQPTKDEIIFTFRTFDGAVKLLLSAKADCPRIQITTQNVENPKKKITTPNISMIEILLIKNSS